MMIYRAGSVWLLAATLTGCSGGDGGGVTAQTPSTSGAATPTSTATRTPPSDSTAPDPTPTPSAEQRAILAQYRQFFTSLTPLSTRTYTDRYAALQQLAVDPALTQVMGGYSAADQAGEVFYGQPVVRPEVVFVVDGTATVSDCQDTSENGRQDQLTGDKVTVGHVNDLARTTMQRGSDGLWRVMMINYAPVGSCFADA